jgi:predicted amidophosphoribosyltransferase
VSFGECESCFNSVTFAGWDHYCPDCLAEQREEDEETRERLADEDRALYTVPLRASQVST